MAVILLMAPAIAGRRVVVGFTDQGVSTMGDGDEDAAGIAEGAIEWTRAYDRGMEGTDARGTLRQRLIKKYRKDACKVPSAIEERYGSVEFLGRGADGCAYLARGKDGTDVVIKAAIAQGNAKKTFRHECIGQMQHLHKLACERGADHLQLVEQYLPTCLDVGTSNGRAYLVTQAAGKVPLADVKKLLLSKEEAQSAFAQLVAALYAVHGLGFTHNDFHDRNIMVSREAGAVLVSVVDLGKVRPKAGSDIKNNLHRDSRALLKHLAKLAQCKGASHSLDRLDDCLVEKWELDEGSVTALRAVVDGCMQGAREQHIAELYRTAFVQKHLPPAARRFHLPGNCE